MRSSLPDPHSAGVDEAGRGPLAGPVFAAAVILDPDKPIEGLRDSKSLSAQQRATRSLDIRAKALAWSIAMASVEEIDRYNILAASMLAMLRAVEQLAIPAGEIEVDGPHDPTKFIDRYPFPARSSLDGQSFWSRVSVRCVLRGDQSVPAIAAASILAKTARDRCMTELAHHYPGYGFERHMGYPTVEHRSALDRLGPSAIHRRTFAWKSSVRAPIR